MGFFLIFINLFKPNVVPPSQSVIRLVVFPSFFIFTILKSFFASYGTDIVQLFNRKHTYNRIAGCWRFGRIAKRKHWTAKHNFNHDCGRTKHFVSAEPLTYNVKVHYCNRIVDNRVSFVDIFSSFGSSSTVGAVGFLLLKTHLFTRDEP